MRGRGAAQPVEKEDTGPRRNLAARRLITLSTARKIIYSFTARTCTASGMMTFAPTRK